MYVFSASLHDTPSGVKLPPGLVPVEDMLLRYSDAQKPILCSAHRAPPRLEKNY